MVHTRTRAVKRRCTTIARYGRNAAETNAYSAQSARIPMRGQFGTTPLMVCARRSCVDCARRYGADLTATSENGYRC